MPTYAKDTAVTSEKSRMEIERTLQRWGADSFMYGTRAEMAMVAFEMDGRRIQFTLPLPDRRARDFTHTPSRGTPRSQAQQEAAYEQAVRQRWRALALVIKAKLEAVEAGITTFEEEFLAHTVLPNGTTVGKWMLPQVDAAYKSGNMPPLLAGPEKN